VQLFTSDGVLLTGATTPVGNFLVTVPDTYTVVCSYDGVTSPACQRTVDVGGYCEELTAVATTGQTYAFTCEGIGSNYLLVITNDQQQVVTTASATGDFSFTYTFVHSGTYTAICFVDGVSNATCGSTPSSFATQQVSEIDAKQLSSIDISVATVQSSPATHLASVPQVDYLTNGFTPINSLVPVLVSHAVDKQISTLVATIDAKNIAPVANIATTVVLSPLAQHIADVAETVTAQLSTYCFNNCLKTITITPPAEPSCVLTTLPITTVVNATSLTVTGSCAFT
jgi:hypothetical protein